MPSEPTSPMERVSSLMLYLMSGSRTKTRQEICEETNLYGKDWDDESSRKQFNRDLQAIRERGIRIHQDKDDDVKVAYRIDSDDASLTLSNPLTDDELIALRLAAARIDLKQEWDIIAVNKLIAAGDGDQEIMPVGDLSGWVVNMPVTEHLPVLVEAAANRAELTFSYSGKKRVVKPLEIMAQSGSRYLAALDDGVLKKFRIDLIEGDIKLGEAGSFEPQPAVDWAEELPEDPLMLRIDEELTCVVAIDNQLAQQAQDRRGKVINTHDDGSIELEVQVRNRRGLLVWLYELGRHAKVLSPPDVAEELKSSLAHLTRPPGGSSAGSPAGQPPSQADGADGTDGADGADGGGGGGGGDGGGTTTRRSFREDISLLFAIVPWAYGRGHTTIADVMAAFSLSKKAALALLRPASVFEVEDTNGFSDMGYVLLAEDRADDDHIETLDPSQIFMAFDKQVLLDKPFDLSMQEAAGLLLVVSTAMSIPGSDPDGALASGFAKVREEFGKKLKLSANPENPKWADELTAAIDRRRSVSMRYDSHSHGEVIELTMNPLKMLNQNGHWYLIAAPAKSAAKSAAEEAATGAAGATGQEQEQEQDAISLYRMSRIDSVQETGEEFVSDFAGEDLTFEKAKEYAATQRVVLSIPQDRMRIVERYPAEAIRSASGGGGGADQARVIAEYDLRSPAILGMMLMLLGEGTQIMNTDELPESFLRAGQDSAAQILSQYEAG